MEDDDLGSPVAEGFVRTYTDHTGRWYEDIPIAEYERQIEESKNDPLMQILLAEIQDEINNEIAHILAKSRD